MTEQFKVRFEGLHGHLKTYRATLSELPAFLLPDWFPLWESSPAGENILFLLHPDLVKRYLKLTAPEPREQGHQ